MNIVWSQFKEICVSKNLEMQTEEREGAYYLYAIDSHLKYTSSVAKSDPASADQLDFETNFKSNTNRRSVQSDIDGAQIVRIKAAKKGWSFWAVPIELVTSTISGSKYCKDSAGVDIPGIVCKIYDGNDSEIIEPGLLNVNLAACVKTVIDFEPTFDYEIIGGALRINSNPMEDIRLWIVGAPDIPAEYGGSKEFASGINLKFMAPDSSFEVDGRVTKYLTYDPQTHQGKMRLIIKHPPGINVNMQFVIHLYRQ